MVNEVAEVVPIPSGALRSLCVCSCCVGADHLAARCLMPNPSRRNPDGLLWRPMPKEMVGPFQALAAKTTRRVQYGTVLGTILVKTWFALLNR